MVCWYEISFTLVPMFFVALSLQSRGLGFDSNSATFFEFRKFEYLNYSNFELISNFHVLHVRCVRLYVPRTPHPFFLRVTYVLSTTVRCMLHATGACPLYLDYNVYCPCTWNILCVSLQTGSILIRLNYSNFEIRRIAKNIRISNSNRTRCWATKL